MTKLSSEEIIKMLPHRYPFLMVDRVQSYKKVSLNVVRILLSTNLTFKDIFHNVL